METMVRLAATLAVIVALLAGALLLKPATKAAVPAPAESAGLHAAPREAVPDPLGDDDRDGLNNFEETLWKTDPHNPDTDGDGTPDGEEVKEGRNPLVKNTAPPGQAPNDLLPLYPAPPFRPADTEPPARQGLPPVSNGLTARGTASREKPDTAGPYAVPVPEAPAATVSESTAQATLRAYGNAIGRHLATAAELAAEVTAFKAFLSPDAPPDAQTALANIGERYLSRAGELTGVSAPTEAQALHAALAEKVREQGEAVKHLASYRSYKDIRQNEWETYRSKIIASGRALYDLALLFKSAGIVFSAGEPGAVFALPAQQSP